MPGLLFAGSPLDEKERWLTDDQKRLIARSERMVRIVSFIIAVVVVVGTGLYFLAQVAQHGMSTLPHSRILVNIEALPAFETPCRAEQLAHLP